MPDPSPISAPPPPRAAGRPRVLFFAEAVTLAHVARPVTLAQSLDPAAYDCHLAWDDRFARLFPALPLTTHAIESIPTAQFTKALARGSPIYRTAELRRYIEADQRVIRAVNPDVIVGDFRLSLTISAALAGIPVIALANAYWSPYATQRYPMPDHPMNHIVGRRVAGWIFNLVRPIAFARYAAPVNRLRREHGLPSLGIDLRRVYTHGDYTLYADLPAMAQVTHLPDNHRFIGPVHWSPRTPLPPWWDQLPGDRPIVYVNLGSSGNPRLLPAILDALSTLDVTALVATAGAPRPPSIPANAFVSDYLPGDLACRRAAVAICNGGSPATQQALAAATPVIGVPTNLDQCLNMAAITRLNAGVTVRTSRRFRDDIRAAVQRLLTDRAADAAATELSKAMASYDSGRLFAACVAEAVRAKVVRQKK